MYVKIFGIREVKNIGSISFLVSHYPNNFMDLYSMVAQYEEMKSSYMLVKNGTTYQSPFPKKGVKCQFNSILPSQRHAFSQTNASSIRHCLWRASSSVDISLTWIYRKPMNVNDMLYHCLPYEFFKNTTYMFIMCLFVPVYNNIWYNLDLWCHCWCQK